MNSLKKIFLYILSVCCFLYISISPVHAVPKAKASFSFPLSTVHMIPPQATIQADEQLLNYFRNKVVEEAMSLRGRPYIWAANGPDTFDCSGFIAFVYKRFGVVLPRFSLDQGRAGAPIKLHSTALRRGDIVYFYRDDKSYPHHVGMYIGKGAFIHCSSGKGVNVSSLEDEQWRYSVRHISRVFFTKSQLNQLLTLLGK